MHDRVKEKLVELIRCADYHPCRGAVRTIGSMFTTEFIEDIASHLIANGVTVQQWIPVAERLPEKGTGKVLVIKQFRGKPYVDIGEVIEGKAYCYSDEYCIKPREHIFTHWMPLPEPPNEVASGKMMRPPKGDENNG